MKPIIHGLALSPFVSKVLVLLEEKGLEYENRLLIPLEPRSELLLAMNPLGKIPVLQHGELTVPDSSVICAYFEALHPEPRLYPKDARELARALWFEEYSDTALFEAGIPVVFERLAKPSIGGGEPDETVVQQAIDRALPPVFDYLESQLDGGATLLAQFSIADLAIGCQFQALAAAGVQPTAARWPKLARYALALRGRPTFQRVRDAGVASTKGIAIA